MQQPVTSTNAQAPLANYELKEITELLVKHIGLHEGLYDLALEFQIAVGGMGPDPSSSLPGAMFRINRVGIIKTEKPGVATIDAAKVNPLVTVKKGPIKKPTSK